MKKLVFPSCAPCSPAPNRRLMIIRNDSQPAPGRTFLTFDSILSNSDSSLQGKAHQRNPLQGESPRPVEPLRMNRSSNVGKKGWSIIRNMMPFINITEEVSKGLANRDGSALNNPRPRGRSYATELLSTKASSTPSESKFQIHSFKFTLEWINTERSPFGKERQLFAPRLPSFAKFSGQSLHDQNRESAVTPRRPEGQAANSSKYAGRALAEWALLVAECEDFLERRRAEGIPSDAMVETPTLCVEPFRRSG